MPLKDVEQRREYQKELMRKVREVKSQGLTKGLTDVPPIVMALADPVERAKMQKLVLALDRDISGLGGKKENMLDLVRRGIGEYSVTMRQVKNLLTAF